MAKRKARKQRKQTQQSKAPQNAAETLKQSLIFLRRGNVEQVAKLVARALELNPNLQEQVSAKSILVEVYFRAAVNNPQERLKYLDEAISIDSKVAKVHHYRALVLWRDYLENKTKSLQETLTEMLANLNLAYELEPKRGGIAYLQKLVRLILEGGELELEDEALNEDERAILTNAKRFLEEVNEGPYIDNGAFSGELWKLLTNMKFNNEASPTQDLQRFTQSLRKVGSITQRIRGIVNYYLGVSEARLGNLARASTIWLESKRLTYNSAHLNYNLGQGQIEQAFRVIDEGKWQQVIKLLLPFANDEQLDAKMRKLILETLAYAHDNMAYEAAQAGNWSQAKQQWQKVMSYNAHRHTAQNLALAEEALKNWGEAALAWRDLLRRRPRKESNPDYLTNRQVMALWRHAAECHLRDPEDDYDESIHCLKKALQYADAKSELGIRQEIVDILQEDGRYEASENELKRILELDPENMQALLKLANFYEEKNNWWKNNPLTFWKRAYQLDPQNQEAKDGLAKAYVNKLGRTSLKEIGKILAEALEILPNHPQLLILQAEEFYYKKDFKNAIGLLEQVYKVAPEDKKIIPIILSKLVVLKAEENLNALLSEVREIPSLSPIFWIRLADDVYEQSISQQDMPANRLVKFFGDRQASVDEDLEEYALLWMKTFLDEGISLAEKRELAKQSLGDGPIKSKVDAFLFAYESVDATQNEELINYYKERIENEFKDIGLLEYVEAFTLFDNIGIQVTKQEVQELLLVAQRKAKKSNTKELIEAVKLLRSKLQNPVRSVGIPKEIERFLEEMELD